MLKALTLACALAALRPTAAAQTAGSDAPAPAPANAGQTQNEDAKQTEQIMRLNVAAGAEQGFEQPTSIVIPTSRGEIRFEVGPTAPPPTAKPAPPSGPDYTPIGVGVVLVLFILSIYMHRRAAPAPVSALHLPDAAYTIVRPLGEGGMGAVYEAIDRKLDRHVAIKRLHASGTLGGEVREQLLQEAKTVAALRHPNIVDVHAIIDQGGEDYIVFELVEGKTLDQLLHEHGKLGLRETKAILGAVCTALEFAHSRGVVHRDLKPANIMLTSLGQIKVMDFGIARRLGGPTPAAAAPAGAPAPTGAVDTTQRVMGTPQYIAPEAYYGQVRPESDVYALGVILYRLLSGQFPFAPKAGLEERLQRAYRRLTELTPELPPAADALVNDALEPLPEKRLRSPKEFRERLAAI